MSIGLGHYLTVAAILFTFGIFGIFLNRKNVIIIMMSIELILLAVNINLVAFSSFLGDLVGQVYALLVLTVAAAEAAIGLAFLPLIGAILAGLISLAGARARHPGGSPEPGAEDHAAPPVAEDSIRGAPSPHGDVSVIAHAHVEEHPSEPPAAG